ncbi:MAG TPA: MBL fold metallo-hydrolase [Acidimicrobiia bacterium]|nr:MBL fold metallo-hydrolase [Acidimicrobiia bacterium]
MPAGENRVRIDRVRTNGVFTLDGQSFEVENNIWLVGDDEEVLVIDAAHDAGPIAEGVGGRRVVAIVCTHGHNDHINAALDLQGAVASNGRDRPPIALHDDDRMLWDQVYADRSPDMPLKDGQIVEVGGATLQAIHTPGHSPGGICLHLASEGVLFSGDTLFHGGPGATGRSFSDFPTIIDSIRTKLLVLAPETVVHTGHGASTTIGDEAPHLDEWIARGR